MSGTHNRLTLSLGGTTTSCNSNSSSSNSDDGGVVVVAAPTLEAAVAACDAGRGVWDRVDLAVEAGDVAAAFLNPMALASFVLSDDAVVSVTIRQLDGDSESSVVQQQQTNTNILKPIRTAFLLAGLQSTSERKTPSGTRVIEARKKSQTSQPTSAIALPLKIQIRNNNGASSLLPSSQSIKAKNAMSSAAVTISLDDDDDNDAMIDEEDLLLDEPGDLAPDMNGMAATASNNGDDCGGRVACDDCTCGRAELEQQGLKIPAPAPMKTSACGKCGMGDAFRCASCPYLGKPAFRAGEEHLVLDLQDDF